MDRDRQIDGQMEIQMDGQRGRDRWMDRDRQIVGQRERQMNGQRERQIDG